MLHGNVSNEVKPFFFGATLVALLKRSSGVQPIALEYTLHRLIAMAASRMARNEMAHLLSPRWLGYGVRGGAEAAVNAARRFLAKMAAHAFVKLDFQNAFNSIHRNKMLEATHDLAPDIYPFLHFSYTPPHNIFVGVTGPFFQTRKYSRVTL